MNENTNQKVVTLESLGAASALIATKAEVAAVKKQVEDIKTDNYATTEEVLALFQEPQQST